MSRRSRKTLEEKVDTLIHRLEKMNFDAVIYLSLLELRDMVDTPLYRNSTFLKNGSQNLIDEIRKAQGLPVEKRGELSRTVGAVKEQKKAFDLLHSELTNKIRGIVYG